LELIRAIAPRYETDHRAKRKFPHPLTAEIPDTLLKTFGSLHGTLRYPGLVERIVQWLIVLHPQSGTPAFKLAVLNTLCTCVVAIGTTQEITNHNPFSNLNGQMAYLFRRIIDFRRPGTAEAVDRTMSTQWWNLVYWLDSNAWYTNPEFDRATQLSDWENAYVHNLINRSDIMMFLLNDCRERFFKFQVLHRLTRHTLNPEDQPLTTVIEVAHQCRDRILEIECNRGDLPTAATEAALSLTTVQGISAVIQLLKALEPNHLSRAESRENQSKEFVLSRLMRVCFPVATDTPAEFVQQVKQATLSQKRLIQLALFAPQWVTAIEAALEIPGFADGVWWIHAHVQNYQFCFSHEVQAIWAAQVSERTTLSSQQLTDGAVDIDWFERVYQTLGEDRWQQLDDAAKYATTGSYHQRARQYANAILGKLDRQELITRITEKRHQDSVRTLGLCPLEPGEPRHQDLLTRYQLFQEFLRTSKQFGPERRANEKLAVEMGLANLARTAGYTDSVRLQWAMEAQSANDLAQPQTVTIGETSISLAISDRGNPEFTITKAGKPLKAIPAALKKTSEIKTLITRKQEISQQATRMRLFLEAAMGSGERFARAELQQLSSHPILAPMLRSLLLISTDEPKLEMGYLDPSGTALMTLAETVPITASQFRIAHPYDLLVSKQWHHWQQECFDTQRQQPFKQIFRELYVPVTAEQTPHGSRRYEGHQVNPRQAIGLFGQRGWVGSLYDDEVSRTFHAEAIVVTVGLTQGYLASLAMDGLTLEQLTFHHRRTGNTLALTQVPPRIFSEVMRDLDLVVSVAHLGGVDPEASAATVEMRSQLLREMMRLMKLTNVQLQGTHVLIEGELGSYSVHLGSAIAHRQPGGALCILPVGSQHRGRIFLPFIDEDPKTAEVVSKVLLLAKDQEIKDPTILEQILPK
jgi:hypothetical protein